MGFSPVDVAEVLRETSDVNEALDRLTTRHQENRQKTSGAAVEHQREDLSGGAFT